jgi:hypothetical protein
MAAFKDLEYCDYFPLESEGLIAIAWLNKDSAFEKGSVEERFFRKLCELTSEPWQPIASAGIHLCELCQFDAPGFSDNVFIPYQGKIFVAPVAIVHYISTHWYQPPPIFVEAVLACPPMKSMEYKKALLNNGGRDLVKSISLRRPSI